MSDDPMAAIHGSYDARALAGVRGAVRFKGPAGAVIMVIDNARITLQADDASAVDLELHSDEHGLLLEMVMGTRNLVVLLLQGRIRAEGNLMLAAEIAGSLVDAGKQFDERARARAAERGEAWPAATP